MAYTSYKHKIYAGNAKRTGENALYSEGVTSQAITPGSAVTVIGGAISLAEGDNINYNGAVLDRIPTTEGGEVTTVVGAGESARAIDPLSGDYVNLLFAAGQNVDKGLAVSASDTVPGKHIIASTGIGVRGLFKTDETLGVLAEDTLVRCIKL